MSPSQKVIEIIAEKGTGTPFASSTSMKQKKEKHARTGTTLLHAIDSIELSVSTPPHEITHVQNSKSFGSGSFTKMRLFRLKRPHNLHHSTSRRNARTESGDQNVVITTPKVKRKSLSVDIPTGKFILYRDTVPQIVTAGSSLSDDTVTPIHTNATSKHAEIAIVAKIEEPPQETFFLMTDFAKNNWMETVTSHSTESLSLGFISIMAATVVIHPILFVAGAATAVWAVGVVHAVEKGYDFFSDGQFKNMFWADSEVEQFQLEDSEEKDNCVEAKPDNRNLALPTPPSPPLKGIATLDISSPIQFQPSSPLMSPLAQTSKRHVTSFDTAISSHFPQLETDVVSAEFPGLNALEFFHVFFSDDAPYSYKEFQQTMGDVDIEFGKWMKSDAKPCSFHPNVNTSQYKTDFPTCSQKERVLEFKTLTKSYFGPAYATAKKTQRVAKFSTRLVIMESMTQLFDIPYSDRFFVLERWVIESVKHDGHSNPSMLYTTKLSVSVQVFMLKPCNWEKQIRSKTLSTMENLVASWTENATQALDLTLKRKLERMRVHYTKIQDTRSIFSFQSKDSRMYNSKNPVSPVAKTKGKRQPKSPGKTEQALLKIHEKNLKLLEQKIASGDLEWCSIETTHCMSAGEGRAFAKVLNPNGSIDSGLDAGNQGSDRPKEIFIKRKSVKPKKRAGINISLRKKKP